MEKDNKPLPKGRARMNLDTTATANYLAKQEEERRAKLARRLAPKKLITELATAYPQQKGE